MTEMSYATKRKKRIIEEELGFDWQDKYPGKSIDAVYNLVKGDIRKNLFCKIDPETKEMLDEMFKYHDLRMAEMVEKLIQDEYDRFSEMRDNHVNNIASQFAVTS